MKEKIAVLLTVHNRCEKTLKCLASLFNADANFDVYLTDDGCTDGTRESIMLKYPTVKIIDGDGTLFWTRGMYKCFAVAIEKDIYDYYLWVNDDTVFVPGFISCMIDCARKLNNEVIVCGATVSGKDHSKITYGGYTRKNKILSLSNDIQFCYFASGNILLIPSYVQKKVGNIDPFFRHALGDFDYEGRAGKLGIKVVQAPNWLGICDKHEEIPKWRDVNYNFIKRIKYLYSPLGRNPIEFLYFDTRHYGICIAIFHFFTLHIRCLFPKMRKDKYLEKE